MPLQTVNTMLAGEAFSSVRNAGASWKAQAENALASMQAGSVTADFVFRMLDQFGQVVSSLNAWKAVVGLDTYATAQAYVGSMVADCGTTVTAAQTCIAWVVANFPASGGFLQSHTLNADGSRTPRSFTSIQTVGLQTNLTAFINTIG